MAKDKVGTKELSDLQRRAEAAAGNGKAKPKKEPSIPRQEFLDKAEDLIIDVGGSKVVMPKKEFRGRKSKQLDGTGSVGFFTNDKLVIIINGKPCRFQANMQLTLINSAADDGGDEE